MRGGGGGKDEVEDDFATLGVQCSGKEDDRPLNILPENADALRLFMACATQWRTGGMGGATGLDYPSVVMVAGLIGIGMKGETLRRLQTLEAEVLRIWSKKS